ncbi:hypothetical protein [Nannocystis sp. SCPEA4]|uniref:hypothetical protein n=1 Tax=Nannocystis sp. SCPEA4 TaxID=2996787 RepID=UPI00226ED3C6|nr:hypothetical protein [Nannocystis sp. SCPEA4]MCY1061056.1 hypothetical protein [Nannocystis sp. SCPEA4]
MRVAARRGMWGFGVALLIAACGEPGQGAATGPAPVVDPAAEVAILAVVEGRVTVRNAQGGETEARAEMPLTRGDTVVTTPGSLAVVVLANGYVLKLEEDQATPVRALAHLDDPPPAESAAELFEKALGAEAFARVGGAGRLERIAGWNARRASGETPAPVTQSEAAPAPVKADAPALEEAAPVAVPIAEPLADSKHGRGIELDDGIGGIGSADSRDKGNSGRPPTPLPNKRADDAGPADPVPPPPAQKPSPSGDEDEKKESSKKSSSQAEGSTPPPGGASAPPGGTPTPDTESSSSAVDLVDSWIFETGPETQVTRTSLPEALKSRRKALAQCVASALPGVAAPELRLKVAGGVVKEVALGGGKPAPACARELLKQRLAGVAGDGWVIVRVRR